MATTRREFLEFTVGAGLSSVTLSFLAPLTRVSLPSWRRERERCLVVLQLSGGNDGLNTVVPFAHDDYYRARARARDPPAGGAQARRRGGAQSRDERAQAAVGSRPARGAAGSRLPAPRSLALPLDGHLAHRRSRGTAAAHGLDRPRRRSARGARGTGERGEGGERAALARAGGGARSGGRGSPALRTGSCRSTLDCRLAASSSRASSGPNRRRASSHPSSSPRPTRPSDC
jgi:hypothetical protein